ncbi:hypothetical protein [Blautia obeum]|uniref:Uncharacterized protein n=1 Tax=Blautia obeum TaxID=40520 RepID=A0A564SFX7_9FIRM|nr:hypothetical protein [Blautia obeum]MBD8949887.1 hypothetical protein [Blautia obeum]VUW93862.1 Uncharacterised protein [Blautia obeum]
MRKKMFRKVTAIMMAAAMMSSGYTMVSADDFTDQEVQTEAAVEDIAVESTEEAVAEETQEADVQIEEEAPAEESESAEVTFEDETTDAFSDGTDPADFAEAEVEVTSYRTDFCFENEEVVITASVSEDAELPENAEMKAEKLEAGSEKYEEAKQASMRDLGTSEDAEYTFYDVTFTVDGNEVELPEGAAVINMEFKDGEVQENETQSALHIAQTEEGTVAQDVTAQTEDGSLKSVDINF